MQYAIATIVRAMMVYYHVPQIYAPNWHVHPNNKLWNRKIVANFAQVINWNKLQLVTIQLTLKLLKDDI